MTNTNAVLKNWNEVKFIESIDIRGETTIQPKQRNALKRELRTALLEDLSNLIDEEVGEVVINSENNIILIANNIEEGNYCIQLDIKVKNLSYDIFEDLETK